MAVLKDSLITGDLRVTGTIYGTNLGSNTEFSKKIIANQAINQLITGTGTAGADKGSGVSPRYIPAKWTFNVTETLQDGDIFTIKIPVALSGTNGYMSVDNGATYYPIVLVNAVAATNQYGVNTCIQLIFESSGSASIYAINGADARTTVTGGVFRILNYYDANTTYSAMSAAEMKAGTATSSRVIRADYLKSAFTASDGIFKTGSANGTISVYGTDIAVKGLGSRAYDSTSYLPLTGGTLTGNLIVNDSTANETTTLSANSLIATGIDVESNTSEVGLIFDGANKVIETTPNTAVYINGYLYANSDELTIASATNVIDDNTDVFLNSSLKMSSRASVNSTPITKDVLYAYNGLDEGIGVLLQGNGTTVVAAGEAGRNLIKENVNNAQAGNGEQLHLASDTAIYFYSNCQTISDRKQISFGADGKLTVPGRIKQADPDALTAFGTYSTANTTVTLTSEYTDYNFLILRFGANNGDNSSIAGISTMLIPTMMINASNEFQHGWYQGSAWQDMKFQFPTTTSLKILTRTGSAAGLRQVLAF